MSEGSDIKLDCKDPSDHQPSEGECSSAASRKDIKHFDKPTGVDAELFARMRSPSKKSECLKIRQSSELETKFSEPKRRRRSKRISCPVPLRLSQRTRKPARKEGFLYYGTGTEDLEERPVKKAKKQIEPSISQPCITVETTTPEKCPFAAGIIPSNSSQFDVGPETMLALKTLRRSPDYDYSGSEIENNEPEPSRKPLERKPVH